MTKKPTSIKDVAKAAGMSLGTVSGVLNGRTGFAEATRKKIWDAANVLHYTPNQPARNMRAGNGNGARAKSGIIIHITHLGQEGEAQDAFEARRSLMLLKAAARLGLYPITYRYRHLKGFQCPPVLNGHVDGAIVGTPHPEVVDALRGKIPMVLMDVPFAPRLDADIPMVNMDYRFGFDVLFAKMQDLGHRKIATLVAVGSADGVTGEPHIVQEISAAAERRGIALLPENRLKIRVTPKTHDAVMANALPILVDCIRKRGATALVLPNPAYSRALRPKLAELGIRVPEDVSLAHVHYGLGDDPSGCCSVRYVWPDLIETSLKVLNGLIEGPRNLACSEYLIRPEFRLGTTLARVRPS
ncbi:MAG: LacI family DNA-binding transcriptional regulator [Kiritimatiellae bacterium]|nr:LacI family DNA-binding transcriptional regulator [Kiritimatiellia bacterium]